MKLNDLTKEQILDELYEKAFIVENKIFLTINNKDYVYVSCDKMPDQLINVKENLCRETPIITFKISDIDSILIMNTEENKDFIENYNLFQDIEFE